MAAERKRRSKAGKLADWLRQSRRKPVPKPQPKPAAGSAGGRLAEWLKGKRKPAPRTAAKPQRERPAGASGGRLAEWLSGPARRRKPAPKPQRKPTVRPQASRKPVRKPGSKPTPKRQPKQVQASVPLSGKLLERLARQREDTKRQQKFRKALKGFRVRKAELGTLIFVSAKDGQRVGKGFRGKVYPIYVTKAGTLKPYTERGQRNRPPVARTIRSLDPGQFRTRRSRQVAEKTLYAKTSRLLEPLVLKSRAGAGLDWDRRVAPKAMELLLKFAGLQTQSFQAAVIWSAIVEVRTEEGSEFRTYTGAADWKMSQAQVEQINNGLLPGQWVLPWIQSKLYADVAQRIGEAEFVTVGSARFVEMLPQNRGIERERWTDARGRKWEKWDYQDVRLVNLTLDARLVNIASK